MINANGRTHDGIQVADSVPAPYVFCELLSTSSALREIESLKLLPL